MGKSIIIDLHTKTLRYIKFGHLKMGRMHSNGHGMSGSALPFRRKAPKWTTLSPSGAVDLIIKLAKKGLTPSQIGVTLRDQHGIPQTRFLTGKKILRILKKHGCAPSLPEDLYNLIKKAVSIRKHLERNRKDTDSKFRLILVESRIHRLTRYFRETGRIAPNWRYDSSTASALVS